MENRKDKFNYYFINDINSNCYGNVNILWNCVFIYIVFDVVCWEKW